MKNRLITLFVLLATAALGAQPNFVFILTDDHGYGDVSAYGAKGIRTPHIDGIGAEGMLLTAMRANCTVCSPTRAAILSGKYPDRVGVPGVIRTQPGDSWGWFDPATKTLADLLGDKGYDTALIGKWHLGLASPNTPNERGFDHFHGFLGDMMDSYTGHLRHGRNYMRLNTETITPEGHATDLFSDWAADYLRGKERAAKPFFLFLAYNAPHFPIEPPAEFLRKVMEREPQLPPDRAKSIAFAEHLDEGIGRVLKALEDSGLAENTVVAFTADNGGSLPHHQSNVPWRGGKQEHYEGGLRVPCMIRWPGKIPAGSRSDHPALAFDLSATFLELSGAGVPAGFDAVSLAPILRGEAVSEPRELYFVRREGGAYGGNAYHALIHGDWKLLRNNTSSAYELYNLKQDPHETQDLAKQEKAVHADLMKRLMRRIQTGGRTPWQPPQGN